jgi:mannose-6-phosphate isomerase-like protein (cupin superfamily)
MRRRLLVGLCTMGLAATAQAADDDAMGRRVQALLHQHQAEIFGCVADAKVAPRGEMLVRVAVGPDGLPAKAEVLKDQSGVPALGPCLTAKLQKWDLAPLQAAAGDQVVFPLVFKPEPLAAGQKRMLVPMAAQEVTGGQRFLIDDQSVGEAPLATLQLLTVPAGGTVAAAPKREQEEEVLYILDGTVKVGAELLRAGDVLWLGADVPRPLLFAAEKKPFQLLDVRAHGEGAGQKIVRAADAKSYPAGPSAKVALLLDGIGAHVAVDVVVAEAGAVVPLHKHAHEDEALFFVTGRATTAVGKESFDTTAGDALRIPAGAAHSVQVAEKLEAIQVYAPAGPEQRFKVGPEGDAAPAAKPKKHHK